MLDRRHRSWLAALFLALSLGAAASACSGSVVVVQCEDGRENCDGECADLTSDPDNCGACGNQCDGGVLGGTCSGATLACDDDGAGGTASLVSVFLNAGQTVTVIVDGFGSNSGSYVLHVQ